MTDPANIEQAEFWDDIAEEWATAERHTELVAGPFGQLAMDSLQLVPGQRVLDVGCGTGGTTLALAERVGPDGEALGIDIAPGMIERARAAAAGATGVRFAVVDPQAGPVDGAPFDAAFSRFGVMFFSDPGTAFAQLHASLRPGGRLGFACWQDLFSNEWMFVPGAAVIGVTGVMPPMPEPGEPGPFSLQDPAVVQELLTGAGFSDIDVRPQSFTVTLPEDRLDSIVQLSRSIGPVREALLDADDDLSGRVIDAVRAALQDKVVDGELRLSAGAHIVSARA